MVEWNDLKARATWTARGAAIGGIGGGLFGTYFAPGLGTYYGAAGGAIGGGVLGTFAYDVFKKAKNEYKEVRENVRDILK